MTAEPTTVREVDVGGALVPARVVPGDEVVYIGCGHEEPCPELARPCSVALYGPMEFYLQRARNGLLLCRPDDAEDPKMWPLFAAHEVSTLEAVAAHAAKKVG